MTESSARQDSPEAIVTGHARTIVSVAALSCSTLVPVLSSAEATCTSTATRVRPGNGEVCEILAEGLSRSPTLAGLVGAVEKTDLLVRVDLAPSLPTAGELNFIGGTSMFRHLRIRLKIPGSRLEMIAWLGHELQHALEIAAASDVRDDAAMRRLYTRIGLARGANQFETRAAIETGWRVRDELMLPDRKAATSGGTPRSF